MNLIKGVISEVTLGPEKVQIGLAPRNCLDDWNAIALNAYDDKNALNRALAVRSSHRLIIPFSESFLVAPQFINSM